jgi:hypothetical protein
MLTTATAVAAEVTAPPMIGTIAGTAAPIPTDWATANRLPAATLPIPDCIPAATEPESYWDGFLYVGRNSPATTPAAPNPSNPTTTGAKK